MFGNHFYHETIKRSVSVFGTLFNNISIKREDGTIILNETNYFLFFTILMLVITIIFIPTSKYFREKVYLQDS